MEAIKRIIDKEIELQEVRNSASNRTHYNNGLCSDTIRIKMFEDVIDSALDSDVKDIIDEYNNTKCNHNVVIRFHESYVTGGPYSDGYVPYKDENGYIISGSKGEYLPNKKHVSYYCICGKKLDKKDVLDSDKNVLPGVSLIDHFGHPDALKVGYNHFKATIDYIQYIAKEVVEQYSTEEHMIDAMIKEIKHVDCVPDEFVRTKSKS